MYVTNCHMYTLCNTTDLLPVPFCPCPQGMLVLCLAVGKIDVGYPPSIPPDLPGDLRDFLNK